MIRLIACAAVVASALAATSAAEAGGGKQLQFGYPLGSFTATPARGGGASKAYARKAKKDAGEQAARKAEPKRSRIAKTEPAARKPAAEPVTKEAAKPDASKTETPKTETTETGAVDEAPRLTGSSALVEQSLPPQTPEAAAPSPEGASKEPGCTKFVPAIGTTVSVECGK
jgi:hypothetical protein